MGSITIRKIDDRLKRKLRLRAAQHNRSMEEEARDILRTALAAAPAEEHVVDAIRRIVDPLSGIDLEPPERGYGREPPDFS